MDDYLTFEGQIEALPWGRATYTVLRLPSHISDALQAQGATRVEGEIAEYPVNLSLSKSPKIAEVFLWTGKTTLDAAGISVGDPVEVRLRKADPNLVEIPGDVEAAIRGGGVIDAWNRLTAGKQRGLLYPIAFAKRSETRAKRIAKLVQSLAKEDL